MEPYNPDVGDVNRDGEIDELDWYILECTGDYIWDFDDDGDIDYTDYVIYFGGEELANEEIDRLEYEYNLEIRDANGDGNIDEIDRYIYIYAGIKDMNNDNVFEYDDILIWFYNDEAQAQEYIEELEQCYERDNREVVLGDVNNDGKTDEIDEFIANIMGLRDYNDDYVFDYSDLVDDYGEMHAEEMISEFESHYKRQNANQNAA